MRPPKEIMIERAGEERAGGVEGRGGRCGAGVSLEARLHFIFHSLFYVCRLSLRSLREDSDCSSNRRRRRGLIWPEARLICGHSTFSTKIHKRSISRLT